MPENKNNSSSNTTIEEEISATNTEEKVDSVGASPKPLHPDENLEDEELLVRLNKDEMQVLKKLGLPASETGAPEEATLRVFPTTGQVEISQQVTRGHLHSGPLPPPEMLEQYEEVLPGAAKRVVEMAEKEQTHRHRWEMQDIGEIKRGQWFGFVLVFISIFLAAVFFYMEQNIAGGFFLTATVLGAAVRFIPGRYNVNQKDTDQ